MPPTTVIIANTSHVALFQTNQELVVENLRLRSEGSQLHLAIQDLREGFNVEIARLKAENQQLKDVAVGRMFNPILATLAGENAELEEQVQELTENLAKANQVNNKLVKELLRQKTGPSESDFHFGPYGVNWEGM